MTYIGDIFNSDLFLISLIYIYNVHCTLYNVQCTVYSVHTAYTVKYLYILSYNLAFKPYRNLINYNFEDANQANQA